MDKQTLQNLWHNLTVPRSTDANEARQGHMTRVALFVANAIMVVATPLVVMGAVFGIITHTFPIISAIATVFLLTGLWLGSRGHWRAGGYILMAVVFLNALYNNFIDGAGTTALAYYAVVIVLTAMLQGVNTMWWALALCFGSYVVMGWAHVQGYLSVTRVPTATFVNFAMDVAISFLGLSVLLWFLITQWQRALAKSQSYVEALTDYQATLEERVAERTAELKTSMAQREQLQQQVIATQQQTLKELSTPVIPVMEAADGVGGIIVVPLIGSIDSLRARDITRSLLAGISQHQAHVVIIDITGVPLVDSGVAGHLHRTIQAARLKGAQTIVTGISDAVAETIVDLGIDWSKVTTLSDLQTGLVHALSTRGLSIEKSANLTT